MIRGRSKQYQSSWRHSTRMSQRNHLDGPTQNCYAWLPAMLLLVVGSRRVMPLVGPWTRKRRCWLSGWGFWYARSACYDSIGFELFWTLQLSSKAVILHLGPHLEWHISMIHFQSMALGSCSQAKMSCHVTVHGCISAFVHGNSVG